MMHHFDASDRSDHWRSRTRMDPAASHMALPVYCAMAVHTAARQWVGATHAHAAGFKRHSRVSCTHTHACVVPAMARPSTAPPSSHITATVVGSLPERMYCGTVQHAHGTVIRTGYDIRHTCAERIRPQPPGVPASDLPRAPYPPYTATRARVSPIHSHIHIHRPTCMRPIRFEAAPDMAALVATQSE
jgi:hypothetical protein